LGQGSGERRQYTGKFNVCSMEAEMIKSKKRSPWHPAVAFIYLALVGAMVLLSATRAFALN
jgi:hypothetical protein